MIKNKYLYSFVLIFFYFILYNGSAFIYSVLSFRFHYETNLLLFDDVVTVLILGLAVLYIAKNKVTILQTKLTIKDVTTLLVLILLLGLFKLIEPFAKPKKIIRFNLDTIHAGSIFQV